MVINVIKEIFTEKAPKPLAPYSQAIMINDSIVFVSGQIPIDPESNEIIYEPFSKAVEIVFRNISEILNASGSSLDNVVKVTIYLSSLKYYNELNEIYKKFFKKPYPARTVIEVSKLPRDAPLEVEVIALLDK